MEELLTEHVKQLGHFNQNFQQTLQDLNVQVVFYALNLIEIQYDVPE
jgi:hypothetical protein